MDESEARIIAFIADLQDGMSHSEVSGRAVRLQMDVWGLEEKIRELRGALYTAMDIMFSGDNPSKDRLDLIHAAAPNWEPGWDYVEDEDDE